MCLGPLAERPAALTCRACALRYPSTGPVRLLGPPFASPAPLHAGSGERMRQLLDDSRALGWNAALARFTADVLGGRLRPPAGSRWTRLRAKLAGATWEDCLQDVVDPTRSAWKFLLDLDREARVLLLGPSWGAVALGLARSTGHVVLLDGAAERLELVAQQARAEGLDNLTLACVRDPLRLPLAAASVDLAIVPGVAEWFRAAAGDRSLHRGSGTELLRELRRVLGADGQAYVGTANGRSLARLAGRLLPGTAYSPPALRRAAAAAGFTACALFAPLPFRHKFNQMIALDRSDRMRFSADAYRTRSWLTRPLVRTWDLCGASRPLERQLATLVPGVSAVLGAAGDGRGFAERLLRELAATGRIPRGELHQYYVRPRGVVVLVTGRPDDRGAIVRLPLDDAAARTCLRHHRAIESLAAEPRLPPALRTLFPRPLAHDRLDGQPFFAESGLPGETGRRYYSRSRARYDRAIRHAAETLAALRRTTEQQVLIDEAEFARLCGGWLDTLRGSLEDPQASTTLDAIEESLRRTLLGTTLPLGWHHGDFDFANLLYAPDDGLTGILDFEVFDPQGLPLVDLLLLVARRPIRRHGVPFGTLFTRSLLPRDLPPLETALLEREMHLLGADEALYRALALCCWLGHLRLRRDSWLVRSPAWLSANLHAVLAHVRRLL